MSDYIKLTAGERIVLDYLSDAWSAWTRLQYRDIIDDVDMRTSIHTAQCLVALRVARRADPNVWRQPHVQEVRE